MDILLETIHGSHLYGLSRPDSDLDTYRVINKSIAGSVKNKQKIVGKDDVIEVPISNFLSQCESGTPQALEAMFSQVATGSFGDYSRVFSLNKVNFYQTYRRTVLNFARLGIENERAKELLTPIDTILDKSARESLRENKPRRVDRNGALKYKRHSLRLLLNLETGLEYGRFNPTLNEEEKIFIFKSIDFEDMTFATIVLSRLQGVC